MAATAATASTASTADPKPPSGGAASPAGTLDKPAAAPAATGDESKAADKAKPKDPVVPITALFRFATCFDVGMMTLSFCFATVSGVIMPLFSYFFGNLLNALNTIDKFEENVNTVCVQLGILAAAAGIVSYCQASFMAVVASRQAAAIRHAYIKAMLRQDQEFADKNRLDEAASRLSEDVAGIEDGIGPKFPTAVSGLCTLVAGIIIAFVLNWKLSLVMLGFVPAIGAINGAIVVAMQKMGKEGNEAYGKAGSVVTEVLTSLRTVIAYGGEQAEVKRYDNQLQRAEKAGVQSGLMTGISVGMFLFILFLTYGIVLLFGAKLVLWSREDHPECIINPTLSQCFSGGTVLTVLFALMVGAGSLGQLAPGLSAMTTARTAAARMFQVIDRKPTIDSSNDGGLIPKLAPGQSFKPRICFDNVTFRYPTRPEVAALQNFSLTIEPGEMVAIIGQSGSGKSTLVALLQRWYDELETGSITLDGINIREYNVQWLRSQQALVQQEPGLFAASIAENIALGKAAVAAGYASAIESRPIAHSESFRSSKASTIPSSSSSTSITEKAGGADPAVARFSPTVQKMLDEGVVTMAEIENAARVANAHEFITAQPVGYFTQVASSRLSGGQKQRLAIARAVIRRAPILLLDEASSALDTKAERQVQAAIDALVSDRSQTTLIIAHRLSTIQNADRVIVLESGRIVEQGTHEALYANPEGVYRKLRDLQRIGQPTAPKPTATPHAATSDPHTAKADSAADAAVGGGAAASPMATVITIDNDTSATTVSFAPATSAGLKIEAARPNTDPAGSDDDDDDDDDDNEKQVGTATATATPGAESATPAASASATSITAPCAANAAVEAVDGAGKRDWTLEEDTSKLPKVPATRLYAYNKPEALWAVSGIICSCLIGCQFPIFSLILSRFASVYYNPDPNAVWKGAQEYLGYYALIGVVSAITYIFAGYAYALLGERLVRRVRRDAFASILRYEVAWHDMERNNAGAVSSRLASDAALLKFATGMSLDLNVRNVASMISGLVIAFVASWRLTLVILGAAPLIVIGGYFQMMYMKASADGSKKAFGDASAVAMEALGSFKLVTAYGLQRHVVSRFDHACRVPVKANIRAAWASGIGFGVSNLLMIGVYALCFWVGAQFMKQGWMDFTELLQSFFAVVFTAVGLGNASGLASDAAKADVAARSLFALIDRKSKVDVTDEKKALGDLHLPESSKPAAAAGQDITLHKGHAMGRIEVENLQFAYPTRKGNQVLKGLTFTVEPGQTVGICGPSGCGKSSLIQLLERFYDPDGGSIKIDGVDLRLWQPAALRSQIGWVQQEAPLFADCIAYNIAYGQTSATKMQSGLGANPDEVDSGTFNPAKFFVPDGVEAAAQQANATDFIVKTPHQFATYVGDKGTQLSGGQKQRVAIARAVIRNAPIFLGDECTAALDSESERVVQAALDRMLHEKRTSGNRSSAIIIAHRLATIKGADKIIVMDNGQVVEEGSFEQLVARGGLFSRMVAEQGVGEGSR